MASVSHRSYPAPVETNELNSYAGIDPTGATLSTGLQAAIDANAGKRLILDGLYKFGTGLSITSRNTVLEGQAGSRYTEGGTELLFTGTGAAITYGTPDDEPHDANLYNGVQDQWIRNLYIRADSPATGLTLDGTKLYKAGTYGIMDWRSGGLRFSNVGIEGFEYGFWGINSDINEWYRVQMTYCKNGVYAGPRSDQFLMQAMYMFYVDRPYYLDRVIGCTIRDARLVECGNGTDSYVTVTKGCSNVVVDQPWLESIQFGGTTKAGFISAGMVDGYGATTAPVQGIAVNQPMVYTTTSGLAGHARSVIDLGAAVNVVVDQPNAPVGNSIGNLDAIVVAPAGTAFTNSEAIATVRGVSSGLAADKLYRNLGSGSPNVDAVGNGPSGLVTQSFTGANTTTTNWQRSVSYETAIPVSGTYRQGDIVLFTNSGVGTPVGAYCVVAGTPGTWRNFGEIAGTPTNFLKTGDYTVLTTDRILVLRAAAAPATFTLPATPLDGQRVEFSNIDSADSLTLARNGRNINDAGSNLVLTAGQKATLLYVTSNLSWYVIG